MNHLRCKTLISSLTFKNPSFLSKELNLSSRFSHVFYFSSKPPKPNSSIVENYLINRYGFSSETASKASTVIRTPEKSYSILEFLEQSGFSNTQLERTVELFPLILTSDLEKTLMPKIKFFQDSDLTSDDIAKIIASEPYILHQSLDRRLVPSLVLLKRFLGTNVIVSEVLKVCGRFLRRDLEKTMIPNVEFMMSCGISKSQIIQFLLKYPRSFILKPDRIKECVNKAKELGHDENSMMLMYAIRVLSSMSKETWELKLDLFRKFGWSEDDILYSFKRAPQVFAVSERKLKEVTGFLLSSGRCDSSVLAQQPELLLYSLETRIKPRIQILDILKRNNFVLGNASLATILSMNDKKFFDKYASFCQNKIGESIVSCKSS